MATSENTEIITTRVPPRVKAILQAEAHRLDLTDAAYVRTVLVDHVRHVVMNNINNTTEEHQP